MAVDFTRAQALKLLHRLVHSLVTEGGVDLSMRQLAVLLTIYFDPPPHTVRGLAAKLRVTKPVITRALDTLGKLELVTRRRDESDRRNVVIQRTQKGQQAIERLADAFLLAAKGSTV